MKREEFRFTVFTDRFFHDLNRYLGQLRDVPHRVITLDAKDRAQLDRHVIGEELPDFQHYRGVGLLWKTR